MFYVLKGWMKFGLLAGRASDPEGRADARGVRGTLTGAA